MTEEEEEDTTPTPNPYVKQTAYKYKHRGKRALKYYPELQEAYDAKIIKNRERWAQIDAEGAPKAKREYVPPYVRRPGIYMVIAYRIKCGTIVLKEENITRFIRAQKLTTSLCDAFKARSRYENSPLVLKYFKEEYATELEPVSALHADVYEEFVISYLAGNYIVATVETYIHQTKITDKLQAYHDRRFRQGRCIVTEPEIEMSIYADSDKKKEKRGRGRPKVTVEDYTPKGPNVNRERYIEHPTNKKIKMVNPGMTYEKQQKYYLNKRKKKECAAT